MFPLKSQQTIQIQLRNPLKIHISSEIQQNPWNFGRKTRNSMVLQAGINFGRKVEIRWFYELHAEKDIFHPLHSLRNLRNPLPRFVPLLPAPYTRLIHYECRSMMM